MITQREAPQWGDSKPSANSRKKIDWRIVVNRILVLTGAALLLCIFVLRPVIIRGDTMRPTYSNRSITFVFLPYFKIYPPERKQVVAVSRNGFNNILIKRVLAFPGETVEIRNGVLYVNDKRIREPYLKKGCNWNLPAREVPKGKVFVLGDNRTMPMGNHMGGMIDQSKLAGVPIW